MTKVIVLLSKKAEMSQEEFARHWRDVHGAIAVRMPGVRRYVQNHVTVEGAPYDGIAEMWFDSPAAMRAAFTSEAAQEAARDAANFLSGQQVIVVEEIEMTLPASFD